MIEKKFHDNDSIKTILIKSVDLKKTNIKRDVQQVLDELNRDIVNLNNDISELTKHGQSFIEGHLNRISIGGSGINESNTKITTENKKLLNQIYFY